jgi:hypothetical protein
MFIHFLFVLLSKRVTFFLYERSVVDPITAVALILRQLQVAVKFFFKNGRCFRQHYFELVRILLQSLALCV